MAGSTASASPLSPELIASLGRQGLDEAGVSAKLDPLDLHPNYQGAHNMAAGHGQQGTLSTIPDYNAEERKDGSPASLAHKRMNSGGASRGDRSHSRSHSKHHSESKTVGEYALHHLFNSVRLLRQEGTA